ncbi:MAG TPA: S8 family serine peptidase [Candidatus Nanoarchaeia archaeon]|nr:S8 family serine peptidase [Candidatus Nanoarchaeia archaeon]
MAKRRYSSQQIFITLFLFLATTFLLFLFFENPEGKITGSAIGTDQLIIDPILEAKLSTNQEARAIIRYKTPQTTSPEKEALYTELEQTGSDSIHEFVLLNAFATDLTKEGLEELKQNKNIKSVSYDYLLRRTLSDTKTLTNASTTHSVVLNGFNITGTGLSACTIDTGVHTNHAALSSALRKEACFCSVPEQNNISCCPDGTSRQLQGTIGDNNGHGTHIAGIIASQDNIYKGISPGAGIVSVKILNSTGHGTTSDLLSALEFCISNSTLYNISVISMSVGCSGGFTSSCDTSSTCDSDLLATLVNIAILNNISVVASTGNSGSTSTILSPACISNVTAVASTTKTGSLSSFSNRNTLTDLLAPGSSIASTYNTGGFAVGSGTSQAAPHVAAATLLVNHANVLQTGRRLTPLAIETLLKTTGRPLQDSGTGLAFPAINIYNAAAHTDLQAPHLTLFEPQNRTYTTTILSLNYTATDPFLSNVFYTLNNGTNTTTTTFNARLGANTLTLYAQDLKGNSNSTTVTFAVLEPATLHIHNPTNRAYNNGTILINFTANAQHLFFFNGTSNETYTQPVFRTYLEGTHTFFAYANTSQGLFSTANATFLIDLTPPSITINTPKNQAYTNINILVNATSNEATTFTFNNGTHTLLSTTGTALIPFSQGVDTLTVTANDSAGNVNTTNITFTLDSLPPVITFISPRQGQTFNSDFILNVSIEDSFAGVNSTSVLAILENLTVVTSRILLTNSSRSYWHSLVATASLTEVPYTLKVNASDLYGNTITSVLTQLEKDITPPAHTGIGSSPTQTTTAITWTTSEQANATVTYGTNQSLGLTESSRRTATSHSITLQALTPGTLYYYNITSCDTIGNCATDGTFVFSTAPTRSSGGSSSAGGGGGGGGGGGARTRTQAAQQLEAAVAPRAGETSVPFELEQQLQDIFKGLNVDEDLTSLTNYSFDKKILIKPDETTAKLTFTFTGENTLTDLFVYVDVPKTFADNAQDIIVTSSNTTLITTVREDPSFLLVYGTTTPHEQRTIELTTKKVLHVNILESFPEPKLYTSTKTLPRPSSLKATELKLKHAYGTLLTYWWIAPLLIIILATTALFYKEELKHFLGFQKKKIE